MHKRIHSGGVFEDKVGYCRAVVTDDGWVHLAGTVAPPDPETGEPPIGAQAQTEAALRVIGAALAEAGADFSHIVRVHYILPNREEFEACWPALRAAFGTHPPAATMFEAGLIHDKYRIEIEVTAKIPG